MEGRKWEELNKDILVNVLRRVGMESLLLDVPFVCKAWYKASCEPQCWEYLIFPRYIKLDDIREWEEESPDRGFAERLAMAYPHDFSVTAFVKFIVSRSCGNAAVIKLPDGCTEETLEVITNECPKLKALDVGSHNIPMKEILGELGVHCHKLIWLSAPNNYFGKKEALALVDSVPQLMCLDLPYGDLDKEALLIILQGCKQLLRLDVRNCCGFLEDDAEVLELASHIPIFMCEGSWDYEYGDSDFYSTDILENIPNIEHNHVGNQNRDRPQDNEYNSIWQQHPYFSCSNKEANSNSAPMPHWQNFTPSYPPQTPQHDTPLAAQPSSLKAFLKEYIMINDAMIQSQAALLRNMTNQNRDTPQDNEYNSIWQQHPYFSCSNKGANSNSTPMPHWQNFPPSYPPQAPQHDTLLAAQLSSLEAILKEYMMKNDAVIQSQTTLLQNLATQVEQLVSELRISRHGTPPSDIENSMNLETEQDKVIALRSDKVLETTQPKIEEASNDSNKEKEKAFVE